MNKKPPLTPPKGEDLGINDNMNDGNKYALAEVSPLVRFRGALEGSYEESGRSSPI